MKTRSHWLAVLAVALLICASVHSTAQDAGDEMFVKVDGSSPEAVVQSSTDFFEAEPVGRLITNQPVEILGETDGEFVKIRCKIDGKTVEGWVKRTTLQTKPLENKPRVVDSGEVDTASFAAGSRRRVEEDVRLDSPDMDKGLKRIDEFERFLRSRFGGDVDNLDPTPFLEQYRKFGAEGGLMRGSMR